MGSADEITTIMPSPGIDDDMPTMIWQPEIPFSNVRNAFILSIRINHTTPNPNFMQLSKLNIVNYGSRPFVDSRADVERGLGARRATIYGGLGIDMTESTIITAQEVDVLIEENIRINSNKMMRTEYLWQWTLKFKDENQEKRYCELREDMFRSNVLVVLLLWVFIVLCQVCVVKNCRAMYASLSVATVLIVLGAILVLAEEFATCPSILQRASRSVVGKRVHRTCFICLVIVIMSLASTNTILTCDDNSVNTPRCEDAQNNETLRRSLSGVELDGAFVMDTNRSDGIVIGQNRSKPRNDTTIARRSSELSEFLFDEHPISFNENDGFHFKMTIQNPEYIVFTWVLCLVSLSTGLKLYYLVKTFLAIVMVFFYGAIILASAPYTFHRVEEIFDNNQQGGMPLSSQMVILLVIFLTIVTYHARLVEVTARLDFIWKEQAERELANMKSNRFLNDVLIKNILPDHVATYYLTEGHTEDELYAKMHRNCGVMFATITNFQDFYSEEIDHGRECIRVLNEIICDFDSLLEDPEFVTVEKIKTTGATYMAACGLNPTVRIKRGFSDDDCICNLVDFAFAMRQKLMDVNKDTFNTFYLRVGICSGPLVSGVIGARKPVYDIWGNTVNVASRMDSTGENWRIQVPDYTAEMLTAKGYTCRVSGCIFLCRILRDSRGSCPSLNDP